MAEREVHSGDELAVFPPVSGGSDKTPAAALQAETSTSDFFELTTDPIDVGAVARRVVLPECGATVTLDGYAREWTKDRRTLYLVYEAYAPMALSEMRSLGRRGARAIRHRAHRHRPSHRRLEIGETSVVIAVSAPHRAPRSRPANGPSANSNAPCRSGRKKFLKTAKFGSRAKVPST